MLRLGLGGATLAGPQWPATLPIDATVTLQTFTFTPKDTSIKTNGPLAEPKFKSTLITITNSSNPAG